MQSIRQVCRAAVVSAVCFIPCIAAAQSAGNRPDGLVRRSADGGSGIRSWLVLRFRARDPHHADRVLQPC
jgi:hypothetical protein